MSARSSSAFGRSFSLLLAVAICSLVLFVTRAHADQSAVEGTLDRVSTSDAWVNPSASITCRPNPVLEPSIFLHTK
jgi:hypothetical protein